MANFNDLLPAPPVGLINVKWQKDIDGNISANYVPSEGDGIPIQINSDEIGNAAVIEGGDTVIPLVIGFIINDGKIGVDIGPKLIAPRAGTITQCIGVVDQSGITGLSFVIKRNGVSIFSSPGIVIGGVAPGTIFNITLLTTPLAVALHDIFSIDIISGTSDWKFTAQLE